MRRETRSAEVDVSRSSSSVADRWRSDELVRPIPLCRVGAWQLKRAHDAKSGLGRRCTATTAGEAAVQALLELVSSGGWAEATESNESWRCGGEQTFRDYALDYGATRGLCAGSWSSAELAARRKRPHAKGSCYATAIYGHGERLFGRL